VIFLDELTAAEPRLQASAYQLILDRCIGKHRLPDQAWVVGAGNAPEDGAVSYGMGTALADRFLHVNVVANPDDWLSWAVDNSVAPEIMAFICVRPEMLDSSGGQAADRATRNAVAPLLGAGFPRPPIKQGSACAVACRERSRWRGCRRAVLSHLGRDWTTSAH